MTLTAAADTTLLVARARTSRWRAIQKLADGLRRDGVEVAGMVLLGDRTSFVTRSMRRRHGVGYIGRHQAGQPQEPEVPTPARAAGGRTRRRQGQRADGAAVDAPVGLPGWIGPSTGQPDGMPEVYGAERHNRVP